MFYINQDGIYISQNDRQVVFVQGMIKLYVEKALYLFCP